MGYVSAMPNVDHKPDLVPTAEVATLLKRDVRTVHRWVAAGKLTPVAKAPGMRGALLFDRSDIDTLAGELKASA